MTTTSGFVSPNSCSKIWLIVLYEKGLVVGLLILLCNKGYEREHLLLLAATHHWEGQVLVGSGSNGPHLYRLRPGILPPCGCQVRHFCYDVTTQLFSRSLEVYFGSKYQTGCCVQEKGGNGGVQELKITVLSALAPSHFTLSKVCVSHGLREVV